MSARYPWMFAFALAATLACGCDDTGTGGAPEPEPEPDPADCSEERCNGLDDDCDGRTDEGPDGRALRVQCYDGPVGTADVGACAAGSAVCVDGAPGPCDGARTPGVERCDGVDDDCDGFVDEDIAPTPCAEGQGRCRAEGEAACVDGARVCGAVAGAPQAEACNGSDDDCDGLADEDADPGQGCEVGDGACAAEGLTVCVDGAVVCDAVAGEPEIEACNDRDDDCDGAIDEAPECAPGICGNGVTEPEAGEECDGQPTCLANCRWQIYREQDLVDRNDWIDRADDVGLHRRIRGNTRRSDPPGAEPGTNGDRDYFRFTLEEAASVELYCSGIHLRGCLGFGNPYTCQSLTLFDAAGRVIAARYDVPVETRCPALVVAREPALERLEAGEYTVRVQHEYWPPQYEPILDPDYALDIVVSPPAPQ